MGKGGKHQRENLEDLLFGAENSQRYRLSKRELQDQLKATEAELTAKTEANELLEIQLATAKEAQHHRLLENLESGHTAHLSFCKLAQVEVAEMQLANDELRRQVDLGKELAARQNDIIDSLRAEKSASEAKVVELKTVLEGIRAKKRAPTGSETVLEEVFESSDAKGDYYIRTILVRLSNETPRTLTLRASTDGVKVDTAGNSGLKARDVLLSVCGEECKGVSEECLLEMLDAAGEAADAVVQRRVRKSSKPSD